MSASGKNSVIGIGRQASAGTGLTVPKFEHVMGGGHVAPNVATEPYPWSGDTEFDVGHYVNEITPEAPLSDLPVLLKSCVPWLGGAIGSITSTPGTPNSHAITEGQLSPQTLFWQQPSSSTETNKNFFRATDAYLGELTLKGDGAGPLLMDVNATGKDAPLAHTKWSAATVAEAIAPSTVFTSRGAVVKVDIATTPATTAFTSAGSVSLNFNRNLDIFRGFNVTPTDIATTKFDLVVEFGEVRPVNNDLWNQIYYGTASGTAIDVTEKYGSFNIIFGLADGTATTTAKIEVAIPRLRWEAEPVDTDPSGSPIAYALRGVVSKGTSAGVTVTVLNTETGTNY